MLKGTEVPLCWPDREPGEVYCFLGAKIWGTVKRVLKLVKSTDCYPLLLLDVDMNDVRSQKKGRIKDYKALGTQVKKAWGQWVQNGNAYATETN